MSQFYTWAPHSQCNRVRLWQWPNVDDGWSGKIKDEAVSRMKGANSANLRIFSRVKEHTFRWVPLIFGHRGRGNRLWSVIDREVEVVQLSWDMGLNFHTCCTVSIFSNSLCCHGLSKYHFASLITPLTKSLKCHKCPFFTKRPERRFHFRVSSDYPRATSAESRLTHFSSCVQVFKDSEIYAFPFRALLRKHTELWQKGEKVGQMPESESAGLQGQAGCLGSTQASCRRNSHKSCQDSRRITGASSCKRLGGAKWIWIESNFVKVWSKDWHNKWRSDADKLLDCQSNFNFFSLYILDTSHPVVFADTGSEGPEDVLWLSPTQALWPAVPQNACVCQH